MKNSQPVSLLAFDLGAESGRAVLGSLEEGRLRFEEVHRFPNGPVRIGNSLFWDILRLWSEIKQGLALAVQKTGDNLASMGLDTWGVDFGLLDVDDTLLGNPYHYRDSRTNGMPELAFRKVSRSEIYQQTGIQFMQLNSLFQLFALAEARSPVLRMAKTFLTIPDLFNYWLTGRKASEFTNATTTQCYNPLARDWARTMLARLGIPAEMFIEIISPGEIMGELRASVMEEIGCKAIPVAAVGSHDTASAVAAAPMGDPRNAIYLSSGTWSLMGVEIEEPLITAETLAYNFTNEGGIGGTYRFLKNIMGLWLVQECRRAWEREGQSLSYDELTSMAEAAPAFGPVVLASEARFLALGDMPTRIQEFCRQTEQRVPATRGEIVRCALESLALEYRWVAERLDALLGKRLPVIHIIGGGSRNHLLNQFTANAAGRQVTAGPVEATAIGNLLVQALALGQLSSLQEGRQAVSRSFEVSSYEPQNTGAWEDAYARYLHVKALVEGS